MKRQGHDTEQIVISHEFAGAFVYFWDIYNDPNINSMIKVYLANKLMNLYNRESNTHFSDFKTFFETMKNNEIIVTYHNELLNNTL